MRQAFAAQELKRELEQSLGFRLRSFERLKCVNSVNFKAVRDSDGFAFCVKCLPDEKRQRYDRLVLHLRQVTGGKAVSRVFERECPVEFAGYGLICLRWCEGERMSADQLTREGLFRFLDDYLTLSASLQNATDVFQQRPTRQWREEALAQSKGPWGGILRRLVEDVPEELSEFHPDSMLVAHGDLHPGNFAFENGRVSGFFDLENLVLEHPVRDLVRYFTFSFEHLSWYMAHRRERVVRRFAEAVGFLPYPKDVWLIAINAAWLSRLRKKVRGRKPGIVQIVQLLIAARFYRRLRRIVHGIAARPDRKVPAAGSCHAAAEPSRNRRVIYATNDRGYRFLKVAVHTLVTHVDPAKSYEICILEGEGGVSAANKEDLDRTVGGRFPVRWVNVDPYLDAHREELLRINKGRTLMIWARIFCGEIFGDVDANALYLDTDTYVNGDLAELFDLDLGDALVGMVPEDAKGEIQRGRVFRRECMPAGLTVYCNAGVMLFNPARWKREEAERRLLGWGLKWDSTFRDQDAVNAVFWDRICILPTKWNYHDGWVERSLRRSADAPAWLGNDPLDVMEAILEPKILHYWGKRKPWKFNHRPERLRYELALRTLGMLDGELEGSTFLKRLTLLFWDNFHRTIKRIVRFRYRNLRAKRGLRP